MTPRPELPPFIPDFTAALRYVLQQHERAVLARMRHAEGIVGAASDANHYETLVEEGCQGLALTILEHVPTSVPDRSPVQVLPSDANTSVRRDSTTAAVDEMGQAGDGNDSRESVGDQEE